MAISTMSGREFNQAVSEAKKAANLGPVFITDRGRPAFALLHIDDYYRMVGKGAPSLLEVMDGIAGGEGIDFHPPRLKLGIEGTSFE